MFRVLAENATGVSSPLEAKNLVKIASPFCKYHRNILYANTKCNK